ncbi:galactose-specific lectin nattectin-like [Notothenia coriiceps]|uniref:Galactose-specific lectin nattectin-like n=1 Tax=Notothenia coriiceps TaxID=8208 RepID=A0A6I9PEK7_9TELE|nr:PREDICTED: galactose-specific lectin nattectin-like [Notothenia coriiceps]XP_010786195.1 PREDICTED: galactose-specific lectin nattectin-like [Notothenia coriiceps]
MASCLHFIVVLCLTSGLWSGANAQKEEKPCHVPCKTCPSGWTPFEDHCYMYKHAAKTWADAEGVWMWSDGSKFDFKGWPVGEPNNSGKGEHCMQLHLKEKDFPNDTKCTQEMPFVCRMRL